MKYSTLIDRLVKLERLKAIEDIEELFEKIAASRLNFCPLPVMTGAKVYRAVPWSEAPVSVEKLSYPPSQYARLGRCNKEGEPVFYCSFNHSSVFVEQKKSDVGATFAVGRWVINSPLQLLLVGMSEDEYFKFNHDHGRNMATIQGYDNFNKKLHAKLRRYFTEKGDRYYPQTVGISRYLQNLEFALEGYAAETLLAYRSVEHPNEGALPLNLSIPTSFVDRYMTLEACEFVKVVAVNEAEIDTEVLQRGNIQGDAIHWEEVEDWDIELNPGEELRAEVIKKSSGSLGWKMTKNDSQLLQPKPFISKVNFFSDNE